MKMLVITIFLWAGLATAWTLYGGGAGERRRRITRALIGGLLMTLVAGAIVALTYGLAAASRLAVNKWGIKVFDRVDRRILVLVATAIVCGTFCFLMRAQRWHRKTRSR